MKNEIEVTVIGDGGAFDTELVNSSFFIHIDDKLDMLIDCGYNVFTELKTNYPKILEDMDTVFITHMDDDHIGSLKTLIYYRYFILNKSTEVVCGKDVYDELEGYLPYNRELRDGKFIPTFIYSVSVLSIIIPDHPNDMFIVATPCDHHIPTYGITIGVEGGGMVMISGDTKATKSLEDTFNKLIKTYDVKDTIVFHDFSTFNNPDNNTHACAKDLHDVYTTEFIAKLKLYHHASSSLSGEKYILKSSLDRDKEVGVMIEYVDGCKLKMGSRGVLNYLVNNDIAYKKLESDPLGGNYIMEITIETQDGFYKFCDAFSIRGNIKKLDGVIIYYDRDTESVQIEMPDVPTDIDNVTHNDILTIKSKDISKSIAAIYKILTKHNIRYSVEEASHDLDCCHI